MEADPKPDPKSTKSKILIIRFSSIGDIVLTTPIIRALKNQIPNVEVHFLTKERNAIIVANNAYLEKIHTFKTSPSEILTELRQEHFSHVVDLQKNLRSLTLALRLRRPYSTFPKINIRKWLLTTFKLDFMPPIHVVDRYFRAVRNLNVSNDGMGLDYHLSDDDFDSVNNLPQNFDTGFVAVACGSQHATKQLPTDMLVNLCSEIKYPIVLLGDKNDRNKAIEIENQIGAKIFNACGVFNLSQTAAIVSKADLILTGDTGLMHIAAALHTNIVAVWGNTTPKFGMSALKPDNTDFEVCNFEVEGLKCRPCSKLGYSKCPKNHFKCMKEQNITLIAQTINRIISR
ncbi:MAG: glycosyltransferase family 9 protein [Bacteroidales bacterium]|jgi:ADP-heptose:LPS heptosyltransferase|nr:glycosyltransferase family 9 protein [Bacteroidales bacterium]